MQLKAVQNNFYIKNNISKLLTLGQELAQVKGTVGHVAHSNFRLQFAVNVTLNFSNSL